MSQYQENDGGQDPEGRGTPAQQPPPLPPGEYPGQTAGREPGYPGQQPGQPGYPVQPYGQPPQNPGMVLGVVGLVLAFFPVANIAGLIVSILGLRKSRRASMGNIPAVIGIVLSILSILGTIIFGIFFFTVIAHLVEVCNDLGPGEHFVDGVTYTCG
ncbi:hypothetical protein [Arthrobacter sp. YD2]|uniref:hypothetical protein n=1 Tax=Arthrobacter sp. YD2 TaxID=3058046 RepID=UPI0025B2DAED|nr:hypothetical protein [Arthrobacter sp. YD2]MDN3905726.1 hypothetical protein [Arthrobacter sp. YD2]